jgi:hypothetical protein
MSRMKNIQSVLREAANLGVFLLVNPGIPAAASFGKGIAGKGCLCVDTANAQLYINSGTAILPAWKEYLPPAEIVEEGATTVTFADVVAELKKVNVRLAKLEGPHPGAKHEEKHEKK